MIELGAPQKFRQRYIAIKVEGELSSDELEKEIDKIARDLDLSSRPWIVLFDDEKEKGLLKCGHAQVDRILEGLDKAEGLSVEALGISGTIKKARLKFIRD